MSSIPEIEKHMDSSAPAAYSITRLPFSYARRNGVMLLPADNHEHYDLVCRATPSPSVLAELNRVFRLPMIYRGVSSQAFDQLLREHYEDRQETAEAMEELGVDVNLHALAEQLPDTEDLLESQDDAPIIRLINAILTTAIKESASDIHIEPYESRLLIRFRVDGVLRKILEPPRGLAPALVSRIKVMARLDIAEKRLPQDGRISLKVAGRAVDVRVSSLPSSAGERIVLRLLDKQAGRLYLHELGMENKTEQTMLELIHRPHGIILVTGPTGSGKSTTLYAALNQLNDGSRNILTVEDPIEYYIEGVGQTQVNTKVDLTFARGLRAILRQDPDVVMVGEIRDVETAKIAVQASLTGHMVLSTLHTNTAIGAVTRLRDMGIEPFLLASSLFGLVAQRLVRKLCEQCREPYSADAATCRLLGMEHEPGVTLFRSRGCPVCQGSGYKGRTGIYELVELDETLQHMIHESEQEQVLKDYARKKSPGIRDDGFRQVIAGVTSLEEVLRVTQQEAYGGF